MKNASQIFARGDELLNEAVRLSSFVRPQPPLVDLTRHQRRHVLLVVEVVDCAIRGGADESVVYRAIDVDSAPENVDLAVAIRKRLDAIADEFDVSGIRDFTSIVCQTPDLEDVEMVPSMRAAL